MVTVLAIKLVIEFGSSNVYTINLVGVVKVLDLPFNGMLVVVLLYLTTKFIYNI